MNELFDGEGFSQTPIDGQEAAQFRHMLHVISREWVPLSNAVTVTRAIAIIGQTIKLGVPALAGAAMLGVYLKTQGFL